MIGLVRPQAMDYLQEIRWRPALGDPSFMGLFTVLAYGIGTILAARVWWLKKDHIWLAVALGMAALCLNKQLDLQSLFTDIGRVAASHEGWYEQRREYQKWFVLGMIGGTGLFSTWFIWRFNAFWLRHKLLSAGVAFLIAFIIVRAISFHHFDTFLKIKLYGVKMNWALELGGILLVSLAAIREPVTETKTR